MIARIFLVVAMVVWVIARVVTLALLCGFFFFGGGGGVSV